MKRNERTEQGGGTIVPSCIVVDDNQRIRIYSGASRGMHFQNKEPLDAALIMHELRLDGFMYLEPRSIKGYLTTRLIQVDGDRLQLNVRAPHGQVRVQLLNEKGVPYEGFKFEDCIPFAGDTLYHTPSWASGYSMGKLTGQTAHIEVEVVHGEIYAIRGDFTQNRSFVPQEGYQLVKV
jgi:hypothetical protein